MLLNFSGCNDCTLKKEWQWLAHPRIPITLPTTVAEERIVVMGEGPGQNEDEQGIPFVGQTGTFLRSLIPEEWKNKLYWTNTIRCRPPNNRAPTLQEIACCSNYLEPDLEKIRPHAILVVGGVALDYFWPGQSITAARGVPFPVQLSDGSWFWVFSIFHPSYVARGARTRDGLNTIEPVFRTDILKFFKNFSRFLVPPTPPSIPKSEQIHYPKTKEEVGNLFARLKEPFGYDIETTKLKPYLRDAKILTAAFSDGELHFSFPVSWPGMLSNWGEEALGTCLGHNRKWVAHNAPFELCWSWHHFPDCGLNTPYEDSMAAARVFYERNSLLSLDDQTKIHTGVQIKSISGVDSKNILNYPLEQILYYNALDAWGCLTSFKGIPLNEIQTTNYKRIIEIQRSTVMMELLGLPVDLEESSRLKKDLKIQEEKIQQEIQNFPEVKQYCIERQKGFLISNPADVGAVLVSYCGIQLPKTMKGNYSTSEDNLQELIGKHALVDNVLNFREIRKQSSTYVEPILNGSMLGIDGLIHSSYTTCLTYTRRLSSQDPNIQNWPKRKHREIRRQIKVPEGHIMVCFDYGQLEARVIAMLAKDYQLIQDFINKIDIHSRWLNRLLELYPPYLERLARKVNESDEKKIKKAARDTIKVDFVFASLYGAIPPTIASETMIPLEYCVKAQSEFWKGYSATKKWNDNQIKVYQETGQVELLTGLIRNQVLPGNEITNTPTQGTAAEIVQEAQITVFQKALELGDMGLLPRLNVHDDISFIIPDDMDLEKRIEILAKELVKPRFDFSICPLIVEAKVGYNWCDLEEIGTWEGDYVH